MTKVFQTEKYKIQLQFWDTAGHERFRSMTKGYFRDAAGAVIVFDLTSLDSFRSVTSWINDVKELARPDVVIILIGNKVDLTEKRSVTQEKARRYAYKRSLEYFETSAVTGENISDAITACVTGIEGLISLGSYEVGLSPEARLDNDEPAKKEGCDC
jgi:small GTP-binding protein